MSARLDRIAAGNGSRHGPALRDGCEWCPELSEPALTTDEHARFVRAEVIVGDMEITGALDRPAGARRGYRAIVDILPDDRTVLVDLVRLYGEDTIIEQVEHMCASHIRGDTVEPPEVVRS